MARLEKRGALERRPDTSDALRTLVWLSDQGVAVRRDSRRVLDLEPLETARGGLGAGNRAALLEGLQALVDLRPKPEGSRE